MRPALVTAAVLSTAAILSGCGDTPPRTAALFRAPALSDTVDGVVWEAGDWTPHLPAGSKGTSWGNHRAVVEGQ